MYHMNKKNKLIKLVFLYHECKKLIKLVCTIKINKKLVFMYHENTKLIKLVSMYHEWININKTGIYVPWMDKY